MKKSEMPHRYNTKVKSGCPYDCDLCEDHEQHSCLSIIEITDNCDLNCPVCYAASHSGRAHRDLSTIEAMLDMVVANEGIADVVQISGGKPTTHPDLFRILDMAKAKPIRHLMLNTNGRRIATEDGFTERLATYMPSFEIYLQFDSLNPQTLTRLEDEIWSRFVKRPSRN